MIELLIRTLCDIEPPGTAEGAYLFAQTVDNQRSVFEAGVDLIKRERIKKLFISAAEPISGYPGCQKWQRELVDLGLNRTDITIIPPPTATILHTRIEAEGLVHYLKVNGVKMIVLVSAPFHQLRCFMTVVSVALEMMPELRIYNRVGTALPWQETVIHSQGTLQCIRSDLIKSELKRIETYQRKGDLVSMSAVLDYLMQRDR